MDSDFNYFQSSPSVGRYLMLGSDGDLNSFRFHCKYLTYIKLNFIQYCTFNIDILVYIWLILSP